MVRGTSSLRSARLGAAASFGLVLSLLLGTGLIAVVSDSVRADGNSVQSGTYTPAGHDLRAAKSPSGAACNEETPWQDGPLTEAFSSVSIDLSDPTFSSDQSDEFCLKNFGGGGGQLVVSFENTAETEVGAGCEASEAEAGDPSCTEGSVGELADVIRIDFVPKGEGCAAAATPFHVYETESQVLDADFGPDQSCAVFMRISINPTADESAKLRAQTDAMQWDVVFTLKDA